MVIIMLIIIILPIIILIAYFYNKDKNEKEPILKVIEVFLIGVLITLQVSYLQDILLNYSVNIIYQSFIVAGLSEEVAKLLAVKFTIFRDFEFDQQIDGIIYVVSLSLGFALIENVKLVTDYYSGIVRSVTAIPAHALFAVTMGYYLGKYKFKKKTSLLVKSIVIPIVLHGIYDYLIMTGTTLGLFIFVPYLTYLWVKAVKDTEISFKNSKFRGD